MHFALNCMSVSCPRLPRTAYTADGLDRELDTAAREFVGEDRNVHVDRETRTVTLSAIFDFYTKDFLAKAPSLIAYVNHYRAVAVPAVRRLRLDDQQTARHRAFRFRLRIEVQGKWARGLDKEVENYAGSGACLPRVQPCCER